MPVAAIYEGSSRPRRENAYDKCRCLAAKAAKLQGGADDLTVARYIIPSYTGGLIVKADASCCSSRTRNSVEHRQHCAVMCGNEYTAAYRRCDRFSHGRARGEASG